MAAHHIPGLLLPLVIALELGAGVAVLLGWQLP
jgi:putative oxidoreductase